MTSFINELRRRDVELVAERNENLTSLYAIANRLVAVVIVAAFVASLTGCAQVVPAHKIPAKPDFIRAGVQAGDSVEIITNDGEHREFVVQEVTANAIEGPSESVLFSDIQSIVKRSWKEPEHPCGGGLPTGCSIPEVVLLLSTDYERQAEKFRAACVTHDFCYRHGVATYNVTRDECDSDFYDDMKKACKGLGGLNVLDVEEFGKCRIAANQTVATVRRHGEKHFQSNTSTYCEYREDP